MPRNTAVGYAVIRKDEEKKKIVDLLRRAATSQGYELIAVFFDRNQPGSGFRTVRDLLDERKVDAAFTPNQADVKSLNTHGFYFVDYLIRYGYM
jgi:hypothetical protein